MIDAKLQGEIEQFKDLQRMLSHCGAMDSEPRNIFYDLMEQAVTAGEGTTIEIPQDAKGWELFAEITGAKSGGRSLARQARVVVDLIQNMTQAARVAKTTVEYFIGRI